MNSLQRACLSYTALFGIGPRRPRAPHARRAHLACVVALIVAGCSLHAESGGGEGGSGGGANGGAGGAGGGLGALLVAEAIATGNSHSCALLHDGRVMCWGDGARGQLGDGIAPKDHHSVVPRAVPGVVGATAIRAGGDTTCAIVSDGVLCWGDGAFGQLGDGVAKDGYFSTVPVVAMGLSGAVDLSVTGTNACAVLSDKTVRCWGRNAPEAWLGFTSEDCGPYSIMLPSGPPEVASYPCEPTPRLVPGAKGAVEVASGGAHNCLRAGDGTARCWGSDQFGQLGDGAFGPAAFQADPVSVLSLGLIEALALGASHTCAVAGPSGQVSCWGDNAFGQLGIGTNTLDSFQVTPVAILTLDGVVDLSSTARTTCAARGDGAVLCWGDTATVLPVSPNKGSALVPTEVPGVSSAIRVRTGGSHACVLLDDGRVVCWGGNDRGQLGTGGYALSDFSLQPVLGPVE